MLPSINYHHHVNWIHRPGPEHITHPVDVFFAYPTVYVHLDSTRHHLMPIDAPPFRAAARIAAWWHDRFLASSCNIFAPYYRQTGMETLWMNQKQFDELSMVPYHDIRDAFRYYLEHENGGRPFILAGHSQGSEILLRLLCRDFGQLDAAKRMVCAYIIGYSITEDDLARHPHIRMARGSDDTGVVVSYNTSAEGLELLPVVRPGAAAVNPLSWTADAGYVPPQENLGSVFLETKHLCVERKHFTGARLDLKNGVVMIDRSAVDAMLSDEFGALKHVITRRNSLHTLDIALFHRNLEKNAKDRIAAFLRTHPEHAPSNAVLQKSAACGSVHTALLRTDM